MQDEFDPEDYPQQEEVLLEEFEDDNDNCEYEKEFTMPYGNVDFSLRFSKKKLGEEEEEEIKEVPKKELEGFIIYMDPKPISREDQF